MDRKLRAWHRMASFKLEDDLFLHFNSFSPLPIHPSEKDRPSSFQSDARMAYCASAILSILNSAKFPRDVGRDLFEHGEVRLDDLRKWIGKCQTWEGGYGASPGLEAQGEQQTGSLARLLHHQVC